MGHFQASVMDTQEIKANAKSFVATNIHTSCVKGVKTVEMC
jgi:hypothetical protein